MTVALSALVLLSTVSVVVAGRIVDERETARAVVLSTVVSPEDIFLRRSIDYVDGRRIYVAHVAPADAGATTVLPPGLSALPAPGESAVSPALDALARTDAQVGALLPRRTLIADEGIGGADELIAYVRPPAGRGLGVEDDALRIEDGQVVGDRITARVSGFGGRDGLPSFADEQTAWGTVLPVVAAAGLLPAALLLVLALRVLSGGGGVLRCLRRAAPGTALGAVLWCALVARSETVPLTGFPLAAGDHALLVTCGVAVGLMCGLVAVIALLPGVGRLRQVEASRRELRTNLRLAPLVGGALLFAVAGVTDLDDRVPVALVALCCVVVGTCLTLPTALFEVGSRLLRSPRRSAASIGRVLHDDARVVARGFYAVALIVLVGQVLVPAGASDGGSRPVSETHGLSAVGVEWFDIASGDVAAFRAALDRGTAFPVGAAEHEDEAAGEHAHLPADTELLIGASCADLAQVLPLDCARVVGGRLPSRINTELVRLMSVAWGQPVASVKVVDTRRVPAAGRVLVVGRETLSDLDAAARTAARDVLPGAIVESEIFVSDPDDSQQRRIDALVASLLLLLGVGALLLAVDRVLAGWGVLGRRAAALLFLSAWASAGLLALVVGYLVGRQAAGIVASASPVNTAALMAAGLLAGGFLGALLVVAARPEGRPAESDVRNTRT